MNLKQTLQKARETSRKLLLIDDLLINKTLKNLAETLVKKSDEILTENEKDLRKIDKKDPIYDRILLSKERISGISSSILEIADYESPIGEIIEQKILKNGLKLKKVRVPLGVVGVIFEARPNVVVDIFSLCFKSKNVCVLKGGSQSEYSNKILVKIIKETLPDKLKSAIELLPNDRKVVAEFLKMDDMVDVLIPRGGKGLIKFVRENSLIPVIETGAGVCHTYFDEFGDVAKGAKIIFNAKTNRPSVCNALDTAIIHHSRIGDLKKLCKPLLEKNVEIRADKMAYKELSEFYPSKLLLKAKDEDFGTEYLSLKMSVKTVKNLQEAIDHINLFGSGHSEAIITENKKIGEEFLKQIDAAAVYINASTCFTDGGVFGLGAEVGISTQKLHARGPMGIKELTSYKWEITGNGQVR